MINFSLEKFRSSDATETFRFKNSDNVLTKSRKLETKSSWIIKLRSFFKFEKAKETMLEDFNFSLLFIYRSRGTCVCNYDMCSQLVLRETQYGRSGAPNGWGPRFLEPAEPAIATPLLHTHTYIHTPTYTHLHVHTHTYIQTPTHTHTHQNTNTLSLARTHTHNTH